MLVSDMTTPVCIHPQQQQMHMAAEAVGALVVAPFLLWASTRLDEPAKSVALVLGIGGLVIDGVLLYRYAAAKTSTPLVGP